MAKAPKKPQSNSVPIPKKKKPIVVEFVLPPEQTSGTPLTPADPTAAAAQTGGSPRKKRLTFRF